MEPISAIASIVGIVQGINGCWKFYSSVKGAEDDIERLSAEIIIVNGLVEKLKGLIEDPKSPDLSKSEALKGALTVCETELQHLEEKLKPHKRHRFLSHIRLIKWPFSEPEVNGIINTLQRAKTYIDLALGIHQTIVLQNFNQKFDLAGLIIAEGAIYGSFADQHMPECLPGTRTELRERIAKWIESPGAECIFWLNGAAGTGKSTISRSTAKEFKAKGQLGASFFFRRGEKDRGNAARLFTTIAWQLAINICDLRPIILKAVEENPGISGMNLKEQCNKLILQPLSQMQEPKLLAKVAIIVIDALDECDGESDQRLIISLLSQLRAIKEIDLRVFLTSRPELPPRLGFKALSTNDHKDVILHEEPGTERDIGIFIKKELSRIREDRSLPLQWPGDVSIEKLVKMAIPLFIFAATACRFIADENWDPDEQMKLVIEYQTDLDSGIQKTYLPILQRLINGQEPDALARLAKEFRHIVGTILVLSTPLSIPSLAKLLSFKEEMIDRRVQHLHSVLDIPPNSRRHEPIRTFHLSFRDFLVDQRLRGDAEFSQFWINEKEVHTMLAKRSIEIMSSSEGLRKDICCLRSSRTLRSQVEADIVQKHISTELQYACCYWVYHLTQSGDNIRDYDDTHAFLEKSLLNWLEAMSLLGNMNEVIHMIDDLKAITHAEQGKKFLDLIYDVKRFVLRNQYIIDKAPLQTHISAIIFIPEESHVRTLFNPEKTIPWIRQSPQVEERWDALLQTLEGHKMPVVGITFSNGVLISGSYDNTVKLWNANTGALLQTLEGHTDYVRAVACLDGILASGSYDETIKIWNLETGTLLKSLTGHTDRVSTVAFASKDIVVSGSEDETIIIWDVEKGVPLRTISGRMDEILDISIFKDLLASTSGNYITLWNIGTGERVRVLYDIEYVNAVAISSKGILAAGSENGMITLWDVNTCLPLQKSQRLEGHKKTIRALTFFDNLLASGSNDKTIKLWNVDTGALLQTFSGHLNTILGLTFFSNGRNLASASADYTVKLWDLKGASLQTLGSHNESSDIGSRDVMALSSDGKIMASALAGNIILSNTDTDAVLHTLVGCSATVTDITFSHQNTILASGFTNGYIQLWNSDTGALLLSSEGIGNWICALKISSDDQYLVSRCRNGLVALYKVGIRTALWTSTEEKDGDLVFSFGPPNSKILASVNIDHIVNLWDIETGALLRRFKTFPGRKLNLQMSFSLNNQVLALASNRHRAIRLCDIETWSLLGEYTYPADDIASINDNALIEKLDPGTLISLKSFAMSGARVQASFSTNEDHIGMATSDQPVTKINPHSILIEKEWLHLDDERSIWIPLEARPTKAVIRDKRVVLCSWSSRVSYFEFK